MNAKIYKAREDIQKAGGIVRAMESLYTEVHVAEESLEDAEMLVNLLYALKDEIRLVEDDIDELDADSDIVDVIVAVRRMQNLVK